MRFNHSTNPPCSVQPRNSITAVTPVTEVKKQPIKPTQIIGYERLAQLRKEIVRVIIYF